MLLDTPHSNNIPTHLRFVQSYLHELYGKSLTNVQADAEGIEYAAFAFKLGPYRVLYRQAKTTPIKVGQFVTLWKRAQDGSTLPYADTDGISFVIIDASDARQQGQFIFPTAALLHNGVFTSSKAPGKRGFRVYPPWCEAQNKQAQKSQQWQGYYFAALREGKPADIAAIKRILDTCINLD